MLHIAAPHCTCSTRWLWLALLMLLPGLAPAAAQDIQWRAGALAAASRAKGSDAVLSSSFEVDAVTSHLPSAAAGGQDIGPPLAGVNYRLWITQGRADVGVGLGSLGYVLPSRDGVMTVAGAVPTVSIGMRYRISDRHLLFADAASARGLGADPSRTLVTTKLGVEWKPSRSTLGFEHGAIGMQLESGLRLSLKSRHGGPVLYLRNSF